MAREKRDEKVELERDTFLAWREMCPASGENSFPNSLLIQGFSIVNKTMSMFCTTEEKLQKKFK